MTNEHRDEVEAARAELFAKARYSDIPTGVFTEIVDRYTRLIRASAHEAFVDDTALIGAWVSRALRAEAEVARLTEALAEAAASCSTDGEEGR